MFSDILPDVVGMNCDVYVSSDMTFVLSVFGEGLVQEVGMSTNIFQRWNFFPIVGVAFSDINADFVYSEFDITTWVLHLNRVLNKDEGTLYLICPFFVFTSGFTSQLLMNTYVRHPT